MRNSIRLLHYSPRTEEAYIYWIKRFIYFHDKRHPKEMGGAEISAFLSHLAVAEKISASTQNQCLCALVFLYKKVLNINAGEFGEIHWAKKPKRLPVVFSAGEAREVLTRLKDTNWIMAMLLYGAGLRLTECLQLRVKDIDFDYKQITIRSGKGDKDRVTLLPEKLIEPLKNRSSL